MKLYQFAEQTGAKTIQLIEIAKASGWLNPHGNTALNAEQQTQIAAVYRFMTSRKIAEPTAAIAQMTSETVTCPGDATGEIAIIIQPSIAEELCRRYPEGSSMSERLLKALGALNALEQLYATCLGPRLAPASAHSPEAELIDSP